MSPLLLPISWKDDQIISEKTIFRKNNKIETFLSERKRTTLSYPEYTRYKWNCCKYQGQDHPLECYKPTENFPKDKFPYPFKHPLSMKEVVKGSKEFQANKNVDTKIS